MKKQVGMKEGLLFADKKHLKHRLMVGVPTTGIVRYEWVLGRYGQVIPCNWSQVDMVYAYAAWSPLGFQVADARNIIATTAVRDGFEWLLFIDSDTIPPPAMFVNMNEYMLKREIPVVSGLYFTKSVPSDPLIYRGMGKGSFRKWKLGDKVWVDGVPMGCTLIHCDIFRAMEKEVPEYKLTASNGTTILAREFFRTPADSKPLPDGTWSNMSGTEDLYWCNKVIEGDFLTKAGFPKIAKQQYPFLLDTSIFCRHIDMDGVQYPSRGEEQEFVR